VMKDRVKTMIDQTHPAPWKYRMKTVKTHPGQFQTSCKDFDRSKLTQGNSKHRVKTLIDQNSPSAVMKDRVKTMIDQTHPAPWKYRVKTVKTHPAP